MRMMAPVRVSRQALMVPSADGMAATATPLSSRTAATVATIA
jgi:hypothetical protein